ncbi:tRNA (adenosine(37)-N6)-dimethylallyltransferase MiaA [Larkinella terrae]|uniref:tRNA dimethylallyltransferase n=1 Tax=Larkinella terrae TaxID=2025311 RepID=A0A7K0EPC0_9BACT|nr:tRNA (adenosine(37)-N6)-dimethylallyltransferase MiaA [Larkinella terrae]MRS63634.1 tRNA (adenosine(37)-N6)-dimethylallyltransferase MiaA [Larkinella terrae]
MPKTVVILGPTASGKTRLAVQVAQRLHGEIISVDSRQVYRDMDIGTGKDLDEYRVGNQSIPYHLINIVDAGAEYNLYQFQQDFNTVYHQILERGRTPILCGGTGLYLEAVLKGHQFTAIPVNDDLRAELQKHPDDELHDRFRQIPSAYTVLADTSTRKRLIRAIEIATYLTENPSVELPGPVSLPDAVIFGIDLPVEIRRQRITERLQQRLQNGMIEEVQRLLESGIPAEKLIFYGLEYKFITQYLNGNLDYPTMTARLETAIHQFAKRQMTFFRKMERDGFVIHWLDGQQPLTHLVDLTINELQAL